ncbi:Arm DNA-binding domain-containing protein [Methylomicrobium sp. RS1]|uniref:Arm DNA-binding domain-containing protein n=1 Tax=Candidatus Methylomicrobium oryzae TaxID=2802053 RepID=UPI001923E605|nr:Arm DNA-binding domain-containing protein [Methylomicrobium sp. RS1]MBL1264873.1 DUF4102 domain-containing protein [Methylomicrobium sp. RS1]
MPLSDINCKNAKPREKPYKLADEKGLFLLVHSNGSKYFRMKYRIDGKEKLLALGEIHPKTTLKKARTKRDEARDRIAQRLDSNGARREI